MRHIIAAAAILAASFLMGCQPAPAEKTATLPSFRDSGELVVLFRPGPLTYLSDGEEQSGFEYELVKRLARRLGVSLVPVVVEDVEQVRSKLARGEAHFAAAGLRADPNDPQLTFTQGVMPVQRVLVTHEKNELPDGLDELGGRKIDVAAGSPHVDFLRSLSDHVDGLNWQEVPFGEVEMLRRVASRKTELTLADSSLVEHMRKFLPSLQVVRKLGGNQQVAWAFASGADIELYNETSRYLQDIQRDGSLARHRDYYFANGQHLEQTDVVAFLERMKSILPKYRRVFHQAEVATGIDWRLLAAISYQESQWNPGATSFTGVQGIMQITEETAQRLQLKNRRDPVAAIQAGAQYIATLRSELPDEIHEPDRTMMTLAAWNIGMGHLRGAMEIAKSSRLNTSSWMDLKKMLPRLSRPEVARRLKAGPARGGEAVEMAESTHGYYEILKRFEPPYRPPAKKAHTVVATRKASPKHKGHHVAPKLKAPTLPNGSLRARHGTPAHVALAN